MNAEGRVALITGGAGGIGVEIARHLALAGARVVVVDLDLACADAVAAELIPPYAVALVVTAPENWAAVSMQVERTFGAVVIFVHNAGVHFTSGLESITTDAWRWVYEVKVVAALHGLRTFLPGMKQRGRGHVVFTSSITALHLFPSGQQGAYTTSKAALLNIAMVLQHELVGTRIGVNAVCPGVVATNTSPNARRARPAALLGNSEEPILSVAQSGMHPAFIGQAVVDAICDGRFYVFSHADYADAVASEQDRVLEAMKFPVDPDHRKPALLLEPQP